MEVTLATPNCPADYEMEVLRKWPGTVPGCRYSNSTWKASSCTGTDTAGGAVAI